MFLIKIIWEYIVAIYASWISFLSGTATVIFIFVTIVTNISENGQTKYWFISAFVSFIVASVSVWHQDRPQLFVEIKDTFLGATSTDDIESRFIVIIFEVTNTKKENNTIKLDKSKLTIKKNTEKVEGKLIPGLYKSGYITIETLKDTNSVLLQGEPKTYSLIFFIDKNGSEFKPSDEFDRVQNIMDKSYVLKLVDSYRAVHKVKGKTPTNYENLVRIIPSP